MKIAIIKEGKIPSDSRVVLSPSQCQALIKRGYDIIVQSSDVRCFRDHEYSDLGVPVVDEVSTADILIGVKEVPLDQLIANKTYFFFSHTIKEQAYNRELLRAVLRKNITLIDYEVLTNDAGARVIAFGKFAGMVGAHNALWTYGKKTNEFNLPRINSLDDYAAAKNIYQSTNFSNCKIVLTGTGRVAGGASLVLDDMGIEKVRPIDFVTKQYGVPVYTQLNSFFYARRKDGRVFDDVNDFYQNPQDYESDFAPFLPHADIMINGIYWDNKAPAFFTKEQMKKSSFNIKVISDVTCDIAPATSIPSTLKASTIADPVFGYDPQTESEVTAFSPRCVDMMTIDNLPNELPKDASIAFGKMFIEHVMEEIGADDSEIINRASIAISGKLGPYFLYLKDYVS